MLNLTRGESAEKREETKIQKIENQQMYKKKQSKNQTAHRPCQAQTSPASLRTT